MVAGEMEEMVAMVVTAKDHQTVHFIVDEGVETAVTVGFPEKEDKAEMVVMGAMAQI